jgi:hypothetical protein
MSTDIQEFEQVVLTEDLPDYRLQAGDVGVVVDITSNRKQYTLEFLTFEGETIAVVPVTPSQVRRIGNREIAHVRMLE